VGIKGLLIVRFSIWAPPMIIKLNYPKATKHQKIDLINFAKKKNRATSNMSF
jgi:hypothetical protein